MNWRDRLTDRHIARARARRHKRCVSCGGPRAVCGRCPRIICKTCDHHSHPTGSAPGPRQPYAPRRKKPEPVIDPILRKWLAAYSLLAVQPGDGFPGVVLTLARPTSGTTVLDLLAPLRTTIPPGYRLWGSGANKVGTFYVAVEAVS